MDTHGKPKTKKGERRVAVHAAKRIHRGVCVCVCMEKRANKFVLLFDVVGFIIFVLPFLFSCQHLTCCLFYYIYIYIFFYYFLFIFFDFVHCGNFCDTESMSTHPYPKQEWQRPI
ncbi:hypothetical protein, unlikely [Trypanosoma brucei gambiense DAL972]|uniref:Uncharacterized protein n=1 Tax=Trypanosoma brucei gambiense (strain MHOM/CI/86/DAL972) TaxID=679716 RepID=D0A6E7_TRYB9|nr:hypothetical protein, unlikely [Trypanosoma brucei gambiense DAL972]CBH17248.1 hypothetical protein, unlikely [Trypanosoma brucei gambiense DAL972]|eukprot:XP_011779512.1 hypothetical protein, unlikely [Trypanosoma brucei gambiense DAL972]